MQLDLVTRLALADRCTPGPALQVLLEGDWPDGGDQRRLSVDRLATLRFGWIDDEADRLHERVLRLPADDSLICRGIRLDYLLGLELRYYLVKVLRFLAVLDELCGQHGMTELRLWAEPGRDEDYAALVREFCRARGGLLHVTTCREQAGSAALIGSAERNGVPGTGSAGRFRELMRRTCILAEDYLAGRRRGESTPLERAEALVPADVVRPAGQALPVPDRAGPIVLCGSPAHLGPLCGELRARSDRPVYWLWERLALTPYFRWRPRGVRFLVCSDAGTGKRADRRCSAAAEAAVAPGFGSQGSERAIAFRGIPLWPVIRAWLVRQGKRLEPRVAPCICSLHEHFQRLRPAWLVVDEDATPFKRAAIAVARHWGAATAVVQHGAPYVSFGFAPLAADWLFAWGEASRRQFRRWGIPPERILVTGSPRHDGWHRTRAGRRQREEGGGQEFGRSPPAASPRAATRGLPPERTTHWLACDRPDRRLQIAAQAARPKRLLLFTTVHHADHRPDIVRFQLTAASYAEMVRMVLRVMRDLPGWQLGIKLHPRMPDPACFTRLVTEFPDLASRVRILRRGSVQRLASRAACVLSCASSAGVEALLSGVPVIQLMPAGSADLVCPGDWGFAGTARSAEELKASLAEALQRQQTDLHKLAQVFANLHAAARCRIVRFLWGERVPRTSRMWRSDSARVPDDPGPQREADLDHVAVLASARDAPSPCELPYSEA